LLAILEPEAALFSVPSKVLTYMTAGKAILAAIAPGNLAARTIRAAGAGLVADPDDPAAFGRMARMLVVDDALRRRCGEGGLAYARENFTIDGITRRFETVFHRVTAPDPVRSPPQAAPASSSPSNDAWGRADPHAGPLPASGRQTEGRSIE
jgi:hypothetical protein